MAAPDDPQDPRSDTDDAARTDALDADLDVKELLAQRDEYKASWQRAAADYQNLRRRMQSDIDSAVARSKKALHQDLLLVLDYLEMALSTSCASADAKALLAGVEMTRAQLLGLLEREGIRVIPEGGSFDAASHQAVDRVETNEHPPGTILATLRKGYTLGGQILRAAQVRVATQTADTERAGESR